MAYEGHIWIGMGWERYRWILACAYIWTRKVVRMDFVWSGPRYWCKVRLYFFLCFLSHLRLPFDTRAPRRESSILCL